MLNFIGSVSVGSAAQVSPGADFDQFQGIRIRGVYSGQQMGEAAQLSAVVPVGACRLLENVFDELGADALIEVGLGEHALDHGGGEAVVLVLGREDRPGGAA